MFWASNGAQGGKGAGTIRGRLAHSGRVRALCVVAHSVRQPPSRYGKGVAWGAKFRSGMTVRQHGN